MNMDLFSEKKVVTTGTISGIGGCVARLFVDKGAQVMLIGRNQDCVNNAGIPVDEASMHLKGKNRSSVLLNYLSMTLSKYLLITEGAVA